MYICDSMSPKTPMVDIVTYHDAKKAIEGKNLGKKIIQTSNFKWQSSQVFDFEALQTPRMTGEMVNWHVIQPPNHKG